LDDPGFEKNWKILQGETSFQSPIAAAKNEKGRFLLLAFSFERKHQRKIEH
jgi:hypothetical protein